MPFKSYERDSDTLADITIEMDLNRLLVQREAYSLLDLLSDIGGMQGIIVQQALLFLTFWNYNNFDNYLVTKLYKVKKPAEERRASNSYEERSEVLQTRGLGNPRDCL